MIGNGRSPVKTRMESSVRFKLLRYFSIASAVAVVMVTAILVVFYGRYATDSLVTSVERQNVILASFIANDLTARLPLHFKTNIPDGGHLAKARHVQHIKDIDAILKDLLKSLPVLKVKAYRDDLTIYSTEHSQIGEIKSSPGFLIARNQGIPASKLSFRGEFNAFEGVISNRNIIETYVPVGGPETMTEVSSRLILEIYTDVTPLVAKIEQSKVNLIAGLIFLFAALYGVLVLIVGRADRVIDRQYEDLDGEITERKEAEKAMQESEKRFKDIAETASNRFWEMDENLVFTANIEYRGRDIFPPPEHFIGRTRWEAAGADPDKNEKWRRHREDLLARRPFRDFEYTITDEDGIIHLSVSGSPIFDDTGTFQGYRGSATDITERKQGEKALKESKERFRSIIDNSPSFITLKDTEGRFQLVNRKHADMVGLEFPDILGKSSFDLHPKKLAEKVAAQDRKVMETKSTVTEERQIVIKQGTRDFLITKFPVLDESGAIKGIGTIGTDITERVEAEEATGRLVAAIEGLSENFALYGPDEKLVICNRNYRRLNEAIPEATRPGVSYEEHMRAVVDKGLAPKAMGREEDYIRERMERYRNPTGPYEVFRQDRVFLVHEQRVADGSMAVIATDITQLKRAEEAKERLSQAIENVPVGIALFDGDDRLVFCNDRYAELMEVMADVLKPGVTFEEMIRTMVGRQPVKDAQGREEEFIRERVEQHRNPTGPIDIRREDKWLMANETRLPDGGIFTIISDVTEQKQAEEDRRLALIDAEQANQAKSKFLAAMSHDLRTPLNAIIGFADILSHQYFGPIGDKNREYAGDIMASGQHLLELVNEILDLSTIEAGKQSLVKDKLSTEEVVRECEKIIEGKARSNGIDLVTKVPENLPPLYADRRAAKQILLNLLSNAVKFTPQGGKITVSVNASKKNTTLKVADTGIGIPVEKLPKLTDPFTRADTDPYLAEDGWGLGLTITKSLIDLHDGTLDIKSTVGKGTTVTVTLPNGAP